MKQRPKNLKRYTFQVRINDGEPRKIRIASFRFRMAVCAACRFLSDTQLDRGVPVKIEVMCPFIKEKGWHEYKVFFKNDKLVIDMATRSHPA